jgi:hypothetical protein
MAVAFELVNFAMEAHGGTVNRRSPGSEGKTKRKNAETGMDSSSCYLMTEASDAMCNRPSIFQFKSGLVIRNS